MNRSRSIIVDVNKLQAVMQEWRRDIHQHPELAFNENRTAEMVAHNLESFGAEVFTGIGKTGVVGKLTNGNSDNAIGLRADMDALPMQERQGQGVYIEPDGEISTGIWVNRTCVKTLSFQSLQKTRH